MYHEEPRPASSSRRSRGRLRAGPSMEEPPAASSTSPRRGASSGRKGKSSSSRRLQRDPSLEYDAAAVSRPVRDIVGSPPPTSITTRTSRHQNQQPPAANGRTRLGSHVLRSDDDERIQVNVRGMFGRRQPPQQQHSKVIHPPATKHSNGRSSSNGRRSRVDDVDEARQDADDRDNDHRRRSQERGATKEDAPTRRTPDPSTKKSSGLYEKAFQDRLRTYKQIEKSVNMYKPPHAVPSRDPPPKKNKDKDWSLTSDTTEYRSTSISESGSSSGSGSSSDDEAKPPPPTKVYLLKGSKAGRTADAESHITMDSGVADYQNSMSSPISTEYRRYKDPDIKLPSPKHRRNLNEWYQANKKSMPIVKTLSTHMSASDDDVHTLQTMSSDDGALLGADMPNITKSPRNNFKMRQSIAYMAILLTVIQLLILMLQVALCGAATWDVNPMFGPYPDAFSEWGGKNPYLMLHDDQWWRLITPSFLHVGFLHLLANAFCQLEAIALFEREWGSFRWVLVYVVSSVGCNAFSSLFDENTIAVGSSGALMGLYAAKLAQVCCVVFFDDSIGGRNPGDDAISLDQMSSVLCGLTIVSLLSSFTYIDWSGHMGGLVAGYLAGMILFSYTIRRCCAWFLWSALGFLGLVAGITATIYFFITTTHPYEELADPCEYFRSLFPEGYVCGCMWQ